MSDFDWFIEIEGQKWKRGVTTGTCAAAAAKAAVYALLQQTEVTWIEITTPRGITVTLPVQECSYHNDEAHCGVVKDAGDDPDNTDGMTIYATVRLRNEPGILLKGGEGVGVVTKPGLQVDVGEAAINPVPRDMIRRSVLECLPPEQGLEIMISVPGGRERALKTLNPVLGIIGGISILGTTGIVEPMSEEAFRHSLAPQIDVALAAGYTSLVFTPGKIGEKIARQYQIPDVTTILTSNFIGYMLGEASRRGVKDVILFGHIGKLVKIAGGIFYTHSKIADGRMDIIAAEAAHMGATAKQVGEILSCVTTEATLPILAAAGLQDVFNRLAKRASLRAEQHVHNTLRVGTVMVSLQGTVLGIDDQAQKIGGEAGWHLK
jgi:cobalt-precorrin-5B (C1)-methyltransferase